MEEVHISTIRVGDTVIHNGELKTVCGKSLKKDDGFMGRSLFGDSYKLGYKLVKKVSCNKVISLMR